MTRKGGLGEDGAAPGWQDSARRGSESHAARLPGGEGGPSPQPSPGACAGQGSRTLQGDSGCGVGVPTAGAQTTLSTNMGEGVWGQRTRAPRAWPTHRRDPGRIWQGGAPPCTLPPPRAQASLLVTRTRGLWAQGVKLTPSPSVVFPLKAPAPHWCQPTCVGFRVSLPGLTPSLVRGLNPPGGPLPSAPEPLFPRL